MKVLLINPPVSAPDTYPSVYMPTGLAYVAGAARLRGHKVRILDALALGYLNVTCTDGVFRRGLDATEIISEIRRNDPDVIGMSVIFSINWRECARLVRLIKAEFPEKILVLGGPHVSTSPVECLNGSHADYVIAGEGEVAFPNLLAAIESGTQYQRLIRVKTIQSLDEIPHPARDLMPMDLYNNYAQRHPVHGITGLRRHVTVITSRGCPYGCVFCAIGCSMGKKYRARSASNVLSEIDSLVEEYKITDVIFEDDNLSFDKERFRNILRGLIDRNYGLQWYLPNGIRTEGLDREMLTLMKKSGCRELYFAVESGSQRVLDEIIRKKSNLEHIRKVIKIATDLGLKVGCFFVIGFPGEKTADMKATWKFMKDLFKAGMAIHWVGYATPYPGTKLLELCYQNGCLVDGFDPLLATPVRPSIVTADWSKLKLEWYYTLLWNRSIVRSLLKYVLDKFHKGSRAAIQNLKGNEKRLSN